MKIQVSRNWYCSYADYSLFYLERHGIVLNILVYVDDLIIAGNDSAAIVHFKACLSTCFHKKNLGVLKYFLGLEISRRPDGLFLSQLKYALDIISEFGLLGAKPCDFPMEQYHQLALDTSLNLDHHYSSRTLL